MNRNEFERNLEKLLNAPDDRRLYNDIGVMLLLLNDNENALKYLRKAYELKSGDAEIIKNYALVLYSVFEWKDAAEKFEAYLRLKPIDSDIIEKASDACFMSGDYVKAAAYLKQLNKRRKV